MRTNFFTGEFTKLATKLEMRGKKGAWTTDHWTGNAKTTFTTTTFHYNEDWQLKSFVLDFRTFHGSTTGKVIYEYQKKVLELDKDEEDPFVVMGVMPYSPFRCRVWGLLLIKDVTRATVDLLS